MVGAGTTLELLAFAEPQRQLQSFVHRRNTR
jgi:hypothetical protein